MIMKNLKITLVFPHIYDFHFAYFSPTTLIFDCITQRFCSRKSWHIFYAVRKIISVCIRLYALSELVSNDRSLGTLETSIKFDCNFCSKELNVGAMYAYIDTVYALSNRLCVKNTQFKKT